ncbi:MAG TPA: hypothetical protein DCS42_15035 [Nitrospiraceae bacterium]|nr:hypothetical protein [Nitrospiraceae bacterium]
MSREALTIKGLEHQIYDFHEEKARYPDEIHLNLEMIRELFDDPAAKYYFKVIPDRDCIAKMMGKIPIRPRAVECVTFIVEGRP